MNRSEEKDDEISVTRFGEISFPLWQKTFFVPFIEGLFIIWFYFVSTFANTSCFMVFFIVVNGKILTNNLVIWSHWLRSKLKGPIILSRLESNKLFVSTHKNNNDDDDVKRRKVDHLKVIDEQEPICIAHTTWHPITHTALVFRRVHYLPRSLGGHAFWKWSLSTALI